jgi:protein required for attachment to host cells
MHTTWVVAADASRARIFELTGEHDKLEEIEDLVHPAGRQTPRELGHDSKGRFPGMGVTAPGHSAEPRVAQDEHELDVFSKRLGDYLDRACDDQRFDRLWVIAPPKFLGLIRRNLGRHTQQTVDAEIPKDVAWFDNDEIEDYLRQRPH